MRDNEDWLIKVAAESQFALPPDLLEDPPELREDLVFYYHAWLELSTDRPASFGGMRPLPWSALRAYAAAYDVEDYDDFAAIVNGVDAAFREYLEAEEQKAKDEADRDRTSDTSNDRPGHGTRRGKGRR